MKLIPQLTLFIIVLCIIFNSGCTSIGYYAQSISGQVGILLNKKHVANIINASDTNKQLREKLIEVQKILDFAHHKLYMPDNGSYRHYTDVKNNFVVWNVIAAPEFSLNSKRWCFLIVGCMNYRGYFNEDKARAYAASLQQKGWEVYVGGVTAYSTLGWFKDPLLNTIINREDWEIARLLFHELAHQIVYIKDDTNFNEAFADSVSLIGLEIWLSTQSNEKKLKVMELIAHESEFTELTLATRDVLEELYQTNSTKNQIRQRKAQLIEDLKKLIIERQSIWGDDKRFQSWTTSNINNARLSLISTYRTLVPDFIYAYENIGSDLPNFYSRIIQISTCPFEERAKHLRGHAGQSITCIK
ncbi:MAG: putative aminopeptidase [Gammaproteobacteria bacterium]|jgi:predicted aminopeptidase